MAKANDPALSQAELKALLDYNPETGLFTWRHDGKTAGTPTAEGYIAIRLLGRGVLAHRLAYFWMYGQWPLDQIDHVNRIRDDNRLINIRPATAHQNSLNRGVTTRSKSGYKGVFWDKNRQTWKAVITIDGRKHQIRGKFRTAVEAHYAYARAARLHHKEFARWETDRPARPAKRELSEFEIAKKARDDATRAEILARVNKMERKPERDWLTLPSKRKNA